MELLKRSICFLLIFTLFVDTTVVYATSLPPNDVEQPVNPPNTPEGVQCSGEGEKPGAKGVCCVGYENMGGICQQPPLEDKSLVVCEFPDDTCPADETCPPKKIDCAAGMACLPQSTKILFSRLAPTTDTIEDINNDRRALDAQLSDIENPMGNGGLCFHNMHCQSYNCVKNKCEEKKVCRMAAEGEVAASGVECGPDLEKQPNGQCVFSDAARNTVYLGLLNESTITPVGKCQFELDQETKDKAIVAMKSLRALEYWLATVNVPPEEECFFVMPKLKHGVGEAMYETRKQILEMFTTELNQIETDYATIIAAGERYRTALESNGDQKGSTKEVTIHKDEKITEGDLGSRILSGYDAMMIMYRRNILFQSYEKAMFEVMKHVQPTITALNTNMPNWNEGSSSFNIGDRVVSGACPGSKYKKKKMWKWTTKYYETVKDRWAWQYDITGIAPLNADIVKREKVSKMLGLLSGYEDKGTAEEKQASIDAAVKQAISDFTMPKYYMLDPLIYGGLSHQMVGQQKTLGKKGGFLGFSGFKDLRQARYIRGDFAGSYTSMHAATRKNIESFYKNLKQKKDQPKFIYEPELVTTYAKACLDPEKTEKCTDFDAFLNDVNDEAFAYFLAYGRHTTDSYSNFFRNNASYRRKLLAKIEVDMQNISKYYDTVIKHRDEQNACIEKVMNGLIDNSILVDGSGGVDEGSGNVATGVKVKTGNLKNLATSKVSGRKTNISKMSPLSRSKFQFNLKDSQLKSLNSNTMLDSVSGIGSSNVDSASVDAGNAFLAVRADAMKKSNEKASKAGINVDGKNKAANKIASSIAKSGARSGSSAGGSSLNTAKGAFGFGDIGGSEVSKSAVDGSSGAKGEGVNGTGEIGVGSKDGAGATNGNANNPLAGIDSGAGGGAGQDASGWAAGANSSGAGAGGKDLSGLSEEERERLLAEAERNKRDYQGSDEDGIFKKVSKAYVRNLDKVLIKKKKVD